MIFIASEPVSLFNILKHHVSILYFIETLFFKRLESTKWDYILLNVTLDNVRFITFKTPVNKYTVEHKWLKY